MTSIGLQRISTLTGKSPDTAQPLKKDIWNLKMNFPFAANTSLKEKTQERQKNFKISLCVLHKCRKLLTVWLQQRNGHRQISCIYIIPLLKLFSQSVILPLQTFCNTHQPWFTMLIIFFSEIKSINSIIHFAKIKTLTKCGSQGRRIISKNYYAFFYLIQWNDSVNNYGS